MFRALISNRSLCHGYRNSRWKRLASQAVDAVLTDDVAPVSLVEFRGARLSYPAAPGDGQTDLQPSQSAIDFAIASPEFGGHALLGRNGSGKSLIGQAIVARGHPDYVREGSVELPANWMSNAIAHVSFDSHQQLLKEGGTTYRAISQGGTLNKAAQFLIIRFGLYSLLQSDVSSLSTGEIRKVMLIRALSTRPKLLILDNAFDGLDVASREVLKDLVQRTISGFTQDILVQGVDSKATSHTQILLITQRAEELVDAIRRVSWFDSNRDLTTQNRNDRTGNELLSNAFEEETSTVETLDWNRKEFVPSKADIQSWWGDKSKVEENFDANSNVVVQLEDFSVQRGEAILLQGLNWNLQRGQRWLIGGGNGAGKSTLSRLLARPFESDSGQDGLFIHGRIGWLATERHMEMATSSELVREILQGEGNEASIESVAMVADWLAIAEFLDHEYSCLSQGQQKLVLIGAALASKPDVLVLDEPCQGLDMLNRQRLLMLVERICQATDIGLVYITHHLEELIPSITHALHLKDREDVYNGPIESYKPSDL